MTDEESRGDRAAERDTGAGSGVARADSLRETAAAAVRLADEVLGRTPFRPGEGSRRVTGQLASVEARLPEDEPLRAALVPRLGCLLGLHLALPGADRAKPGPASRETALRHLRWSDERLPPTDPLATRARGVLLLLLVPAHCRRAAGRSRGEEGEQPPIHRCDPRDLTAALGVLDRLAVPPQGPERRQWQKYLREEIEATLSSASVPLRESPAEAGAARARPGAEPSSDPLAAALGTVLAWAHEDVRRFTDVLRWLCSALNHAPLPPAQAAEQLAGLGLDAPEFTSLHALFLGLRTRRGERAPLAGDTRRCADAARLALRAVPPNAPERPRLARIHAALLLHAHYLAPGTMDFAEVDDEGMAEPDRHPAGRTTWCREIGLTLDQFLPAVADVARMSHTHDRRDLERSVARLRRIIDALPRDGGQGAAGRRRLIGVLGDHLSRARTLGGNLQDTDALLAITRDLLAEHHRDGSRPPVHATLLASFAELSRVRRGGDPDRLRRLIEELSGRYASLRPDDSFRFRLAEHLAEAHHELAARGNDPEGLRVAAGYLRAVTESDPPPLSPLAEPDFRRARAHALVRLVRIEPGREAAQRAVAEVHRVIEEAHAGGDAESGLRHALGSALLHASRHLRDADLLNLSIAELDRVREAAAQGPGGPRQADALAELSEAYWLRSRFRRCACADRDRLAGLDAGREALLRLSADVLLQLGADHGLSVARAGAARAQWLAHRNAVTGRPARAVEALELGRALVLRAAAASRTVPELLVARDRPDLAARWRAEVPDDLLRPGAASALLAPSAGPQLLSSLRRTVLDVLGAEAGSAEPLGVPDSPRLAAGLAEAGADALVYLVPGVRDGATAMPGFALVIRPGAGGAAEPAVLKLPLLAPGDGPLERYLAAAAERSRAITGPAGDPSERRLREERWRAALNDLCDWAWTAAMGPVLAAVSPLTRRPRMVLVPCDRLGAVPWHAARIRFDPGPDGAYGHRYACQEALISYAASGTQFLRAAARERMRNSGRRVLVADPELDLLWPGIETEALRSGCYPDALRYGEFPDSKAAPDAYGTPAELLAVLPGGDTPTAVLHISCHALAGPSPTRSALRLARPVGGRAEAGRLTVARILDGAATRPPEAAGPLVVLSACETDLSTRDHEEALTLATALVVRGAADVVGSRWAVRDAATALMMVVFHHFLTARGHAPPDALRAAQLWMLDPDREPPPGLPPSLAREASRPDLGQVHLWAAFTHQGSPVAAAPGPAGQARGTGS
ncbi:CHAT domain-containing protein [Streptomyces sp. DSM 44917]|uniref:CHAT domain-containing protein n=1 Tax=Streptomyces boetiae TaxID=3075541 RepID=A0ABU2LDG3_9ACTN|nr:CHAT domain-containing protein [Streptomyces sp. DSM 44917]MDT0309521.1 CHAT domain-containing protein [Streptomyces sp. DSM 44917]